MKESMKIQCKSESGRKVEVVKSVNKSRGRTTDGQKERMSHKK